MSDLDLDALRAKAEAATPGPWTQDGHHMSLIIKCTAERGSPEARHLCGDYITVADAGENWVVDAPFIAAANPTVVLALIERMERAEALIAKAAKATPVYNAVEKILDEHSAWIARPNRKVTEAVALAAVIAADIETGASHVLGALHERCDAAEAEISRLRDLLARAGEALAPFYLLSPGEEMGWADDDGWTDRAPRNDRICDWFSPTCFRAARNVAHEIEEALNNG